MNRRGHAGRTDSNQTAVVEALRKAGCTVQSIASVGRGVPDLLVGKHGRTFLLEVKCGKGKLTEAECQWIANWGGHVAVIRTPEDALSAVDAQIRQALEAK